MREFPIIKGNNMKNKNLHNIKSTGFKIPEDYFGSLEDAVFSKMTEQKITSTVNTTGFKAPNDYFETLDAKIVSRVETQSTSKVIPLFNWKKVAYISGIAASLILAINVFSNSNPLTFDDLETASIENYLIDQDLNSYDIAPFLGTADLSSENFVENTIQASEIEDYLLQNSNIEYLITD